MLVFFSSLHCVHHPYIQTSIQGDRFQGSQAILQKLTSLAFQRCQHHISSVDAQPSLSGGINVFVTGHLLPEGESNPLKFSQVFHLTPVGGSFVVTNGTEDGGGWWGLVVFGFSLFCV